MTDVTVAEPSAATEFVDESAPIYSADLVLTVDDGSGAPYQPTLGKQSWEDLGLPEDVIKGVRKKGFARPSKVQAAALPLLLRGDRDLVAQAQNGSGKTAAFSLAMLASVKRNCAHTQAVCICPTRELAQQNLMVIQELASFTDITSNVVVPGGPRYPSLGWQIICGTPGKLRESCQKRLFPAKDVAMLILDEADVMVDRAQGMASQVQDIRKHFHKTIRLVLFSATYAEDVRNFAFQMCRQPCKITVEREQLTLDCVSQFFVRAEAHQRFGIIDLLYGSLSIGQSVIFVNSRHNAFDLASSLKEKNHGVSLICGSQATGVEKMDHTSREKVMKEFRSGATRVLVATDVLSRGIDVPSVTLVINFDLPTVFHSGRFRSSGDADVNMETYMHRVGRTGRFGLKGIAVNLVAEHELGMLESIKRFYSCDIKELPLDPEKICEMMTTIRA